MVIILYLNKLIHRIWGMFRDKTDQDPNIYKLHYFHYLFIYLSAVVSKMI